MESRIIFTCLLCFSTLSCMVAYYCVGDGLTSAEYPIVLKETTQQSLLLSTEKPRIHDLKQILEAEFDKYIDFAKILQLRSKVTAERLSTNLTILIPPHQQDNGKVQFYHSRGIKKPKKKRLQFIPRQRTCAVIGNSGILLDSQCGAEIDAHDFVLRSNMALTKDYINDVGNKTNLMTLNSNGTRKASRCMRNISHPCYANYLDQFRHLDGSILWFTKFGRISNKGYSSFISYFKENNVNILIAHPFRTLIGQIKRVWDMPLYSPSSGLFLYTVSVSMCDRISLYGFYPFNTSSDGRNIPYHYYEDASFKTSHNMTHEFRNLLEMSKQGYFRIVTGKCVLG